MNAYCECGCGGACQGQMMFVQQGFLPNPHIAYGQRDIDPYPVTFRRHLHWAGAQLHTGVDTITHHKIALPAAAYNFGQTPRSPGLDRVNGRNFADFVPRGPAPAQWNYHFQQGPGLQPSSPGGPGQVSMATPLYNPGTGA